MNWHEKPAALEPAPSPLITHYAVIVFSGDPSGEHPCPELNGSSPTMSMIASGNEEFCWNSIARWTAKNPLRMWEKTEILARHESVIMASPNDCSRP